MIVIRLLVGLFMAALVVAPVGRVAAQEVTTEGSDSALPRIGFLFTGEPESTNFEPFESRLAELGYVDGVTALMEWRFSGTDASRGPLLAEELLAVPVDVIVTNSTQATLSAKQATDTVPIIFAGSTDPVGSGLVRDLERPDGNVTGMSFINEPADERLRLLHEVVPGARRVAVIGFPAVSQQSPAMTALREAADDLGIELMPFTINSTEDVEEAVRSGADAGIVIAQPITGNLASETARLAAEVGMPIVHQNRAAAASGGLIGFGADPRAQQRLVIDYMDAVLHGTPVADLPVHEADELDLVVNLQTAQAMGIEIPQRILGAATEVLQ